MLSHDSSQRIISIRRRSPNAEFLGHPPGKDAPGEIFDRLAAQFTDYLKPDRFRASWIEMKLALGDPELDRLLSAATTLGLRLPEHSRDQPCQVSIRDYPRFTADEINAADYVECERFNPFIVCSSEKAPKDLARVASNQYIKQCRNQQTGAFVNLFHLLAVRGRAKATLETAGLKGLELLPLIPDSGNWPVGIEPLCLVWSSTRLPPSVDLVLNGDFQVVPQLRYHDFDPSGADVAITDECFGSSPHYHRIVYSQRARQVLETIDSQLLYRPVITEAEQSDAGNLHSAGA